MKFRNRANEFAVCLILLVYAISVNAQNTYKSSSELSSGKWRKFRVAKTGIYAVSFEELKGLGIEDPANISIYGQQGGVLPLINDGNPPDDISEIPLYFNKGNDGVFNKNDLVYFFLKGPDKWGYDSLLKTFVHEVNPYSYYYHYFIRENKKPTEIKTVNSINTNANVTVNTFDDHVYHELDTVNVIQSGRTWYGEKFLSTKTNENFTFNFPNLVKSKPVILTANVVSRSDGKSSFTLKGNNKTIGNYSIRQVNISDYTDTFGHTEFIKESIIVNSDEVQISVTYNPASSSSEGYLDYIRLHVLRQLIKTGGQMGFRSISATDSGNVARFILGGVSGNTAVWDVSDIHGPKLINGNLNGNNFEFNIETGELKEFIAFNPDEYYKPVFKGDGLGVIDNQDLHSMGSVDYVIVTHGDFERYASELAGFHRDNSGLSVVVVDQEKVFNEFSSGTRDVAAVRNFLKMLYDRSNGKSPRYLLLFGDGTFDNKRMVPNNDNFILTYQSAESLSPIGSYVSDDFYGLLDDNEELIKGRLDVGIGRFPVSDTMQAKTMVKKVKLYMNSETRGDWRNNLLFIGDDEDSNLHMDQADDLSDIVENKYPWFNRNKIFLDAYKQVSTAVGARYPDVNKSIFNQLEKGVLLVNYTGHGAEFGLAHERILSNDDIRNWSNWGKLPIFMTATCEFSRFDFVKFNDKAEYEREHTTGEFVVTYPKGGAIASFTTTRIVYSNSNFELNKNFFKHVFEINPDYNERNRLGDIIRKSKVDTYAGKNKRNFSLLGDPAIMLAYPQHKVVVDSINGVNVQLYDTIVSVDSLVIDNEGVNDTVVVIDTTLVRKENQSAVINGALSYVTVSGHVEKENGGVYDNFNGILNATIFDKVENITTLDNDHLDTTFEFELQNNILFKGKASVKDGYFNFSFFIPKDIAYVVGKGKISCYAYNDETDATGWDTTLIIGGFENAAEIEDNQGPDISMFLGNYYFKEDGITNESPSLLIDLYDVSGINTSTSGLGHEMVAVIDNNFANPVIMNDFYEAETDDYKKGNINYPLLNLEPGKHTVRVKVWDVLNNSSEDELTFDVKESDNLVLRNVYTYPNPMSTNTNFVIEHNFSAEEIDITVHIFGMNGQLIKILKNSGEFDGYLTPVIRWDGKADNGNYVQNGLYFYRVTVTSEKGVAEKSSKMLIIR